MNYNDHNRLLSMFTTYIGFQNNFHYFTIFAVLLLNYGIKDYQDTNWSEIDHITII